MNDFILALKAKLREDIEIDGVLYPVNEMEVSEILLLANQFLMPIYTKRIKNRAGYEISLDKMGSIVEICEEDFLAVVECGMKVSSCKKIVEDKNLFFPLDYADMSIGAAFAKPINTEFKYYVLGLRVVSPTGQILNFGGRTIKNVTGYNISGFYYGSKGLFGIITHLIIKLTPLPKFDTDSNPTLSGSYPQILYNLKKIIDPNSILG